MCKQKEGRRAGNLRKNVRISLKGSGKGLSELKSELLEFVWAEFHDILMGKAIPVQAWTGPEGSRRLRLQDFKTVSTLRW